MVKIVIIIIVHDVSGVVVVSRVMIRMDVGCVCCC